MTKSKPVWCISTQTYYKSVNEAARDNDTNPSTLAYALERDGWANGKQYVLLSQAEQVRHLEEAVAAGAEDHGTVKMYGKGCRCEACRAAEKLRKRRPQKALVDAKAARKRIRVLVACGYSYAEIARLAKSSANTIRRIAGKTDGGDGQEKVKRSLSEAILSIRVGTRAIRPGTRVDARKIRSELVKYRAAGFSARRLAFEIGVSQDMIREVCSGEHKYVTGETYRKFSEVYDELERMYKMTTAKRRR